MESFIDHRCFQVEKIIGIHIGEDNSAYYQVQWASTWEPLNNLIGCEHLIKEFWMKKSCQVLGVNVTSIKEEELNDEISEVSINSPCATIINNNNDEPISVETTLHQSVDDLIEENEVCEENDKSTDVPNSPKTPNNNNCQAKSSFLFPSTHGPTSRKSVGMSFSKRKHNFATSSSSIPSKRPCSITEYSESSCDIPHNSQDNLIKPPTTSCNSGANNSSALEPMSPKFIEIQTDCENKVGEKVFGSSPTSITEAASFSFGQKVFEIHNEFMRFASDDVQKVLSEHEDTEIEDKQMYEKTPTNSMNSEIEATNPIEISKPATSVSKIQNSTNCGSNIEEKSAAEIDATSNGVYIDVTTPTHEDSKSKDGSYCLEKNLNSMLEKEILGIPLSFVKISDHIVKDEKLFNTESINNVHFNKVVLSDKPYICLSCNLRYKSSFSLRKHCRRHHKQLLDQTEIDIKCNICARQFLRFQLLNEHVKEHKLETNNALYSFACGLCDEVYKTIADLKNHCMSHEYDLFDTCVTETIETAEENESDVTDEIVQPLFKCPSCPIRFAKNSDLKKHALKHVQNKMGYKGKSPVKTPVKTMDLSMTKEIDSINEDVQPLSLIKKKISTKISVPKKTKTVKNDNEFCCNYCDLKYSTEKLLQHHIHETHSIKSPGETFYHCPLCPNSKPKKGLQLFNSHCKKYHGNEEAFPSIFGMIKCPLCLMFFPKRRGLLLHMCKQHDMKSQEASEIISLCVEAVQSNGEVVEVKPKVEIIKPVPENNSNSNYSKKLVSKTKACIKNTKGAQKNSVLSTKDVASVLQNNINVKRVGCVLCYRTYENESCLLRHVRLKHRLRKAEYKIKTEAVVQADEPSFKKFQCLSCSKQFMTKGNLTRHAQMNHSSEELKNLPNLKCVKCLVRFEDRKTLFSHTKIGCSRKKNRSSSQTKTSLNKKNKLKSTDHKKKINNLAKIESVAKKRGRKPLKFPCPLCPKKFSLPILLASHTKGCRAKTKTKMDELKKASKN